MMGVPGIGKSRLVWELFQAVERDPDFITWRQGRSLPYGDGVTYWALGEMVKAQAGILDSDTADEALDKLRAAIADLIHDESEAAWVEEHLRALSGLETGAPTGHERRPAGAGSRILPTLRRRPQHRASPADRPWWKDRRRVVRIATGGGRSFAS